MFPFTLYVDVEKDRITDLQQAKASDAGDPVCQLDFTIMDTEGGDPSIFRNRDRKS
jgi:hypothetical protein